MRVDLKVTPKQRKFIDAEADEVLFGGAAGGGKSYGQVVDAFLYAMQYGGSKQVLFRRSYPELENSIIRQAMSCYPRALYQYNASQHTVKFINGSILDFRYIDTENDVHNYQSAEYDIIRFDELTHFTEYMYVYMLSRLRGANDFPKRMKSTCNPGGVGHTWVKERFIDVGAPDTVHELEHGSRIFIPSKVTDNLFLMKQDQDYIKRLQNLPERERKALLEGSWDLTDGMFFPEVRRGEQIVPPFDIPKEWNRYFVMDYGLDMLAGYLIAVDGFGQCSVYREIYEGKDSGGGGLIVSEAAERIKELIGADKVKARYAPPDLWNRQKDTGKSVADLFREHGLPLVKVSNDRVQGWLALKEMLKMQQTERGDMAPRLQIFTSCRNLVRCITSIQVSDHNPNDAADQPHELTHSVDAMRYFASAHYRSTEAPEKKPVYNFKSERPPYGFGRGERTQVI